MSDMFQEKKTSFPEQAIFHYARKYYPDTVNGEKDAIGMELDIYIPSEKIAIEYDGITFGKEYKAIGRDTYGFYLVMDNSFSCYFYAPDAFEIVADEHEIISDVSVYYSYFGGHNSYNGQEHQKRVTLEDGSHHHGKKGYGIRQHRQKRTG